MAPMAPEVNRRKFLGATGTLAAGVTGGAAITAASVQAAAAAPAGPLKILGICCSPRKGKTTSTALRVCLDAAHAVDPRIEVELIELGGLKIPGEVAADIPLEPGERDDFPQVAKKLSDPAVAGIILGTPVYFGNMSSLCKAFIDRCIVFHTDHSALSNKVAGVLAVGGARNGGVELTVRSVQVSLTSQQMIVVGDGRPTGHWGGTAWSGADAAKTSHGPDITRDGPGMATMKNLGRRVAEVVVRLARS
jgi:multimeric flavodoxin WrbA